jgi:hypothetical protein
VALGGERVAADQEGRDLGVDQLPGGEALHPAGQAVAGQAGVGLDAEEDEGPGRRLGAQRHRDGDAVGGRLDARDLHRAVTP